MDFNNAKKQYKILSRELSRVRERGQSDSELEARVRSLLEQFPELNQVETKVSASAAMTLAYGDIMSSESVQAATVADETLRLSCQGPSPPSGSSNVDKVETDILTSSEQLPDGASLQPSSQTSSTNQNAVSLLGWVSSALQTAVAIRGPPRFPRFLQFSLLIFAATCAIAHRLPGSPPCSRAGSLFDPVGVAVLLHLGFLLSKREPHPIVYVVKDFIPSVVSTFVVFACTVLILNVVGWPRVPYFC